MLSPAPDTKAIVAETARWFEERKHLLSWDEGPRQRVNEGRRKARRQYASHLAAGTAEQWVAAMEKDTLEGTGNWDLALCTIAADYIGRGESVPPVLRRFTRKVLHRTFTPPAAETTGHHKGSNFSRDTLIVDRIKFIERTYGISPTVNEATDKECGCSIVAKALKKIGAPRIKTKSAVMAIWKKRYR